MSIHDILNAGIGLYKEGEKGLRQALEHLQSAYDNLKRQGEADQSETAERLRQALDQIIASLHQVSSKAEARLQGLVEEAGRNYEQLLSGLERQIDTIMKQGEKDLGGMRDRIQTLAQSLKEQAPEQFRRSMERLIAGPEGSTDPLKPAQSDEGRVVSIIFSESEEPGPEK